MVMITSVDAGKPEQPDAEYDLSAKMEEQSRNLKLLRREVELISTHLRKQHVTKKESQSLRMEHMTHREMSDLLTRERQKLVSEKSSRNHLQGELEKVKYKLEEQKHLTSYYMKKHDETSRKLQKLQTRPDHVTQ